MLALNGDVWIRGGDSTGGAGLTDGDTGFNGIAANTALELGGGGANGEAVKRGSFNAVVESDCFELIAIGGAGAERMICSDCWYSTIGSV